MTKSEPRSLRWPVIWTVIVILLIILGFTPFINVPQCPDSYTQAQIDSSNCIIGANIGLGMYFMLIIPAVGLIPVILWIRVWISRIKHRPKT